MPRFRRPCQTSPKSYPFRPHNGGEIHGQSLFVAVYGLLSAFVGPMLLTPSDIATCPSKSVKWWFEKHQESKHRDHPERPTDLYAWFPQLSRPSRFKLMVSHLVFRREFQCDHMLAADTTFGCVLYPCTTRHTLQSVDDSIGVLPFAFKTRITARTSHFAVVLSGTSITKVCQAKTKLPISVCASLD